MENIVSRTMFIKVTGVTAGQIASVHSMEALGGRNHPRVLSSKLDEKYGTYTVEMTIPIDGYYHVSGDEDHDSRDEPWFNDREIPHKLFEILGAFPE